MDPQPIADRGRFLRIFVVSRTRFFCRTSDTRGSLAEIGKSADLLGSIRRGFDVTVEDLPDDFRTVGGLKTCSLRDDFFFLKDINDNIV